MIFFFEMNCLPCSTPDSDDYFQDSEQGSLKDSKSKRKLERNDGNESCEESDGEDIWNAMDVAEDEVSNHKSKSRQKTINYVTLLS